MFIDASALVAILANEPGNAALARAIKLAAEPITSALAVFETATAVARKNGLSVEDAQTEVYAFLDLAGIRVVVLRDTEARGALAAYARYGKGQGHPARLNMGDCFAYACAQAHDVALLFVGDDFPQTDIRSAMA